MSNGGGGGGRTSLWDGEVREWLKIVELDIVLNSFAFYAVALALAIIFGVPFVGALNVWPAYGWLYLVIILGLYLAIDLTIHNTASLNVVALDTLLLALAVLLHVYCFATLVAWLVMQPLGLVPLAAQREFSYTMHAIMAVLHVFRLIKDGTGVRYLLDVHRTVRKRRDGDRMVRMRGTGGLQNVNADDEEQEMQDM